MFFHCFRVSPVSGTAPKGPGFRIREPHLKKCSRRAAVSATVSRCLPSRPRPAHTPVRAPCERVLTPDSRTHRLVPESGATSKTIQNKWFSVIQNVSPILGASPLLGTKVDVTPDFCKITHSNFGSRRQSWTADTFLAGRLFPQRDLNQREKTQKDESKEG